MTLDRNSLVGLFVLGGIALAVAAAAMFGNFSLFSRTVQAVVVFQNAINGLSVGAAVTFRGVPIGSVDTIGIAYDAATNTAYIPVTVRLELGRTSITSVGPNAGATFDVPELVKRGLRAQLQMQSYVTGQAQIDLEFDPGTPLDLHAGLSKLPEIPTRPSAFQRAREQLTELPLRDLAVNANQALESVRTLADTLDKDLPPLMASLKVTSDRSADAVVVATEAIKQLQGQLGVTLDGINKVAATGDLELRQRGAELHTLLTGAAQAINQTRDVLSEVKSIASSRANTRQNLDSTLRDLAAAAASLRGFAADVEQDPRLLLTGRGRGQ
ncbi:MAG: MlaD family protein [Rhodopila sp.]